MEHIYIEDCKFQDCNADGGGAVYIEQAEQVDLTNLDFTSCQSSEVSGGALILNDIDTVYVSNCDFYNCEAGTEGKGGGINAVGISMIHIENSDFDECLAGEEGGGMYVDGCTDVLIDSCSFMYNESGSGGALTIKDSKVDITHCEMGFNEATNGGACYIEGGVLTMIDNSLFYENYSTATNSQGGALYVNDCVTGVINSTITENSMNLQGGGISHLGAKQISIYNTILWNNQPTDIWFEDSTKVTVSYSDITNEWSGTGNISQYPIFEDVATHDYQLDELSPCIDVGKNSFVQAFADLNGHVRIWDGTGIGEAIVDIGCYEYGAPIYAVDEEIPETNIASLIMNYPNPFTQETQIKFYLPASQECMIDIYNIKGQKIKTLIKQDIQAGYHSVRWDGRDNQNREVANGIYFYVLKTEEQREVKKLVLMR